MDIDWFSFMSLKTFMNLLSLGFGLIGALYWYRSSRARIPYDENGPYAHDMPQLFEDDSRDEYELVSSLMMQSSLNGTAARLTAVAVILTSISGFLN